MMEFWTRGACSVREIQEAFPEIGRPAYTTIQTVVYRLENKGALRNVKRIGNPSTPEPANCVKVPLGAIRTVKL